MRSFSDLAQLFGRVQVTDGNSKKSEKSNAPQIDKNASAPSNVKNQNESGEIEQNQSVPNQMNDFSQNEGQVGDKE